MKARAQAASAGAAPAGPRPWPGRRGEALALGAILLTALVLRLWGLEQNGWGAEYYTAAVRSMSLSLHNFFYNAFDPAGFISLDKPPGALWPQVASVKLLGFRPLSVLLPQVLEGVASVALLYGLTRRWAGVPTALLAALFLAITPVWVAVNRTNNTDSCLLLVLLLAAGALLKAAGKGSRGWLCGALALVGLAFNVKMLAAFMALPAFVLVYALGAPLSRRRRLGDLTLAGGVLLACCLPWVLAVELTPAPQRPYVGSSSDNSLLELIVGHNALGRFVHRGQAATPGPAPAPPDSEALTPLAGRSAEIRSQMARLAGRLFVRTPPGPLRLLEGQLAGQVAWLLPLALAGLGLGRGWLRRPLAGPGRALLLWLGWTATYVIIYSYLGGIFHFYYLATLAPPLAVLAALGLRELWGLYRLGGRQALLLPAALLLCALWQLYAQASGLGWSWRQLGAAPGEWLVGLHWGLAAGALAAAAGLAGLWRWGGQAPASGRLAGGLVALGLAALLLLPLAWVFSSVLRPGHGVLPSADAHRLTRAYPDATIRARVKERQAADLARLMGFLEANHGGERFLLATSTTQLAAPIIVRSGQPVLARGGFHGLDRALKPADLERLVQEGRLRFAMLGDVAGLSRRMGADRAGRPLADWVRAHGQAVDPRLWRASGNPGRLELFDLRPGPALLAGAGG